MITICSQPDVQYFHWQNIIQFNNFKKLGILESHRAVFLYTEGKSPSEFVVKFKEMYPNNVFYYEDKRKEKSYIPTLKIHGVVKYLEQDTQQKDLMLIDSDIILRETIDYSLFTEDNTVYCSDTKGYLGYQYLRTKGDRIIEDMAKYVGVTLEEIIEKNDQSGGAQLYYKGVDDLLGYFKEVEEKCTGLYNLMVKHPTYNDYKPTIQSWTSEMWCVLWLLWKRGVTTEIHKELDFRWATDNISKWEESKILHMAGVVSSHKDKFFKGGFINKPPFDEDYGYVSKDSITHIYLDEMMDTKNNFKELIEFLK
jgi:hypothetical protein